MSTDSADPTSIEPAEKLPRNPIERVIVWGGIGLLLVVAGIETRAQRGYAMSLEAVQSAFSDNEEVEISLSDARQLMVLAPAETKQLNVSLAVDNFRFSWFSLFKSGQYEITFRVTSDEEQQVVSFATPAAPEPAWMTDQPLEGDVSTSEEGDFGGGGFPGGGGNSFGGGRFRPPPNALVTHLDSDGDNELSAEEIEGSPAALQALDANGDGELTPEEFDPDGVGRRGGGGSGGFGAGGAGENESESGRPRRPEFEE
jgi:hypothetical protein